MSNIRELEKRLWEAADSLRAESAITSNQYCMPVLGLIFLRCAFSRYKLVEKELQKNRPSRGGRILPIKPEEFSCRGALYLPREAQYDYLLKLPKDIKAAGLKDSEGHKITSLGEAINNAMCLIEKKAGEQLSDVLPKNYTDMGFSDKLLGDLLRNFNDKIIDEVGGDVIGRIYEYFLNKFARNIAADDGVFFTPKSLVKLIVNIIEPQKGVLLDPACGSGGMFVQSGDFVNQKGMNANDAMTFFGQEKVKYNARLCLMNMAVHGLAAKIASGDEANTFYKDKHELNGKCDYVMANPPFNVDKVSVAKCKEEGRLPFGLPGVNRKSKEISNANYLWISYFYSYLNDKGRAGFVMASSATDSQGRDKDIRQKLVETGHVDVMVSVGNNFFYTKSLPCSLWFFDKAKAKANRDRTLFIDARNYYTVVDRTLNEWSTWQLKNLTAIVHLYRGQGEKYAALLKEYHEELKSEQSFAIIGQELKDEEERLRAEAKEKVAQAKKAEEDAKEKQKAKGKKEKYTGPKAREVQTEYDKRLAELSERLTVAREANWLYEKFGDGVYADVPGLCKIADRKEIEAKGWSLTPGAYVGVAPIADDGVDFATRMGEIHRELLRLQAESSKLMDTISRNMEEMGL